MTLSPDETVLLHRILRAAHAVSYANIFDHSPNSWGRLMTELREAVDALHIDL